MSTPIQVRDGHGRVHHVDAGELQRAQRGEQNEVRIVSRTGTPLNSYVDRQHRHHITSLPWTGAAPAVIQFANIVEVIG